MNLQHVMAWGGFLLLVLGLLALDLLVLHRKPHEIRLKEALIGAVVPVLAAVGFGVAIYFAYQNHFLDLGTAREYVRPPLARFYPGNGAEAVLLYFTGYLVELSLSADNVFLFVILMTFFKVPREYQHRVLFWGVLGALVMRGIMIVAGAALLSRLEWVIYLFGAFLIYTGVRMVFHGEPKDPSNTLAVRVARKVFPIHEGYEGKRFFTRTGGRRAATTLFLVLICIEFTDLVFALDSIPAIFGITRDAFIVFTSNVFAILGLRSMYFLLAGVMDKFHLLKYGLAAVLGFVGIRMVLPGLAEMYNHFTGSNVAWDLDQYKGASFIVILGALGISIVASLVFPCRKRHANPLESHAARV